MPEHLRSTLNLFHIVTWRSDYKWGFGLEIRFIYHFNTRLVTTLTYSVIPNFHTLQITTAHTKYFQSSSTSHFLSKDLNNGDSSTTSTKSSLHGLPYNWLKLFANWLCYNWLTSRPVSVITSRLGQTENTGVILLLKCFHGNVFVCEGVTQ
jgi:hypothetical protein